MYSFIRQVFKSPDNMNDIVTYTIERLCVTIAINTVHFQYYNLFILI